MIAHKKRRITGLVLVLMAILFAGWPIVQAQQIYDAGQATTVSCAVGRGLHVVQRSTTHIVVVCVPFDLLTPFPNAPTPTPVSPLPTVALPTVTPTPTATVTSTEIITMALTDNLISYWSLEESSGTRVDAHGANDLTDNNTVTSTTGKVGTAADFVAGNAEWLSRASNTDVQTGNIDFTFAAWVNIASKAGGRTILAKFNNSGNLREYLLDFNTTSDRFRFVVSSTGANTATLSANSFGSPSTGTWYFIVAWHDATANTLNIQVNDGTVDSLSWSNGVFTGSADFTIGRAVANGGVPAYWNGQIDDVGFWKRVLLSTERTDLYNSDNGRGYAYISSGGQISGTASITFAPMTATASGTVDIAGTAAPTLAPMTLAATGTVDITGTASPSFDPMTVTATATVDVTGSAAPTFDPMTVTATGTVSSGVTGSADISFAPMTLASTGAIDVTGSAAPSFAPMTLIATGTLGDAITGSAAITFAPMTVTAAGSVDLTGTADLAFDPMSVAATATAAITGSAAQTFEAMIVAAAGTVDITGTANITFAPMTLIANDEPEAEPIFNPGTIAGMGAAGTVYGPKAQEIVYGMAQLASIES